MSMLKFSPPGQHLVFLFLKHYYEIYSTCQKTDQVGTPKLFSYNSLSNYAITMYSICLQTYDPGLSDKPKYITLPLVVLEI